MKALLKAATILVVEDDQDDRYLIQRAVQKARLANPIRYVQDGEEAIAYLAGEGPWENRDLHPLPFLVFLDLHMPRINGFEVLRWIRSRPDLHHLKVAVLTDSTAERDYAQAMESGADSYFTKPGSLDEFVQLMVRMQGHWILIDGVETSTAVTIATES